MQRVGINQHQLNQDELLRISRAISDTTRYAQLETIYFDQQITVGELCAESTVSAATVAHHIKILNDAHLTGGAKDYDPRVFDILSDVAAAVGHPDAEIDIICGYRTEWSNEFPRARSAGWRRTASTCRLTPLIFAFRESIR